MLILKKCDDESDGDDDNDDSADIKCYLNNGSYHFWQVLYKIKRSFRMLVTTSLSVN